MVWDVVAAVMRCALIVLCSYVAATVVELHAPMRKGMDWHDVMARYGIAAVFAGVALTTFMAMIDVGPTFRLPVLLFASAAVAVGVRRDQRRARGKL